MFESDSQPLDHSTSGPHGVPETMGTSSPTPLGRRAFIAGTVGAAAVTAVSSSVEAAVPSGASYYESVDPVRLADTRRFGEFRNVAKNFQTLSDRSIRINIKNSPYVTVPDDAVAVVVSIAAIYNGSPGFVAAVPAGSSSFVSNINMEAGDGAVANLATVKIGNAGKIDINRHFPYDVVVDILGVYRATSSKVRAGRMQFLSATKRALSDTRMTSGSRRKVNVPVPKSAQAAVVNLTVAGCRTPGFITAGSKLPPGPPKVSNLNYNLGDTRAAGAIVKVDQSGSSPSIELYSHGDAQVFVDVTGYITGENDSSRDEGLFVPVEPFRVMDTRRAADFAQTGKKRLWPEWTRAFELPNGTNGFGNRSEMAGVAMNATLVTAMRLGYMTVLPARTQRQFVSNLNASRIGHVAANHVISRCSTRGVEMFAHSGGDVIADIAGWYTGRPQAPAFSSAPFDPPAPPAAFNWFLSVPKMGVQNFVAPNLFSGDPVVDSGNTWHWTNTGLLGNNGASIVVFGHRTSKGGPYRDQHLLVSGDRLFLDTPDQRRYEYRFVGERLTDADATNILNAARTNSAGSTFTLVACTGSSSVADDQPRGGIRFRLVSTFVLVGWTDLRPNVG